MANTNTTPETFLATCNSAVEAFRKANGNNGACEPNPAESAAWSNAFRTASAALGQFVPAGMRPRPLYRELASAIDAKKRCEETNNTEWLDKWETRITQLVNLLPSGSGIDSGTELDEESTGEKLILLVDFHHMNDGGYYDGWTSHKITITASLTSDFDITVTGRNRNDIKEYLADTYSYALSRNVVWNDARECYILAN